MNTDLLAEIQNFHAVKFDKIRELLQTETDLRGKINPNVQLSASAVVKSNDKMIFILHPYQKEILLPAGHVELDESPMEAAAREFYEETGFSAENGRLIDVNLITIPYNSVKNETAHLHIDYRYKFEIKRNKRNNPELSVFFLTKDEAPEEFKAYYDI